MTRMGVAYSSPARYSRIELGLQLSFKIILPLLFLIALIIAGTMSISHTFYHHQPLPKHFTLAFSITFSILVILTAGSWLVLRTRQFNRRHTDIFADREANQPHLDTRCNSSARSELAYEYIPGKFQLPPSRGAKLSRFEEHLQSTVPQISSQTHTSGPQGPSPRPRSSCTASIVSPILQEPEPAPRSSSPASSHSPPSPKSSRPDIHFGENFGRSPFPPILPPLSVARKPTFIEMPATLPPISPLKAIICDKPPRQHKPPPSNDHPAFHLPDPQSSPLFPKATSSRTKTPARREGVKAAPKRKPTVYKTRWEDQRKWMPRENEEW